MIEKNSLHIKKTAEVYWSRWFQFVFSIQNPYFCAWWVVGGQKYSFFAFHVSSKNTIRVGILMRYENFFLYAKDAGAGEFVEFTINNQYGLYYFLNRVDVAYVSSSVPSLDMRKIYNKILTNRRFLKISLRTSFFRSRKLTRLLQKFNIISEHSVATIALGSLLMFVFKIFTTQECMWFVRNGLVRINNYLVKNEDYRMRCGDVFSWIGGVFFFSNILYFRFSLNRWLWRKRRRNMRKLTKFVFYGGDGFDGLGGLNRLQKTIYTGDMYWGVEWDYRLCSGVTFLKPQLTLRGQFNNRGYVLQNLNVWSFTH